MGPTEVVERGEWDTTGIARRFSRSLQPSRVRGVVFHWPGDGARSREGLSAREVGRLLRGYQAYHRRSRGWPDLGYLLAVDLAGRLYEGAGFVVGAHSATARYPAANQERVGVLLVLGSADRPSPAMLATGGWLREALPAGRVPLPGWKALPGCHDLHGHRDMAGASTTCPGEHAADAIRAGRFTAAPAPTVTTTSPTAPTAPTVTTARYTREQVVRVQNILVEGGFYPKAAVDGMYGERTRAAAYEYQQGQRWPRLRADGDFGPRTLAHAEWTVALQRALNGWRSSLPDLRLDYDYGDLTWERVREWQRRNRGGAYPARAAVDGQAGRFTVSALGLREHP